MLLKMEDVSIADLKAAYDFNLIQIQNLKDELKDDNNIESNGGLKELMVIHNQLYMGLANRVSEIEIDFPKK